MPKEYLVFVESLESELHFDREIQLTLKDLTPGPRKYDNRVVKARVSPNPADLPGADVLYVRSWTGVQYPQTFAVKVTEELGALVPGVPHGETLRVL